MGRIAPCSFPAAVPSAKGRATKEREPTGENANFSDNSDDSDNAQTMERGEGREKAFLTVPTEEVFFHPPRPKRPKRPVTPFPITQKSKFIRLDDKEGDRGDKVETFSPLLRSAILKLSS